jgi:hypothetical protein
VKQTTPTSGAEINFPTELHGVVLNQERDQFQLIFLLPLPFTSFFFVFCYRIFSIFLIITAWCLSSSVCRARSRSVPLCIDLCRLFSVGCSVRRGSVLQLMP